MRILAALVALLIATACRPGTERPLSAQSREAPTASPEPSVPHPRLDLFADLINATSFEIYSLDPWPSLENDRLRFRGVRVIASSCVPPALALPIVSGLWQAHESNDGLEAACFYPRYGLHADTPSGPVDLLIATDCLQVRVFEPHTRPDTFLITADPEGALHALLGVLALPTPPPLAPPA